MPHVNLFHVGTAIFVVFGIEPHGIRLEAEVNVHADHDAATLRVTRANIHCELEDLVIRAAAAAAVAVHMPVERNLQTASAFQRNAFRQLAARPHFIQHAGNEARTAPALAQLALEIINLLDHADGNDDVMLRVFMDGIGIVKKNIGINDVIIHTRGISFLGLTAWTV